MTLDVVASLPCGERFWAAITADGRIVELCLWAAITADGRIVELCLLLAAIARCFIAAQMSRSSTISMAKVTAPMRNG